MKTLDLIPGTPEWEAHRFNHDNASECAAMLGLSKKMSRNELLRMKATGNAREFSQYVREKILASGHAAEAAARPQIEKEIGEDLYPLTCVSDEFPTLSCSFDGVSMGEDLTWECKVWNEDLVAQVRAGELTDPDHIYQLEQQRIINTGAVKTIFTVARADGSEKESMEYVPVPGRREQILAGWEQFRIDLAAYVPEPIKAEAIAAPVETLPAITYDIDRKSMALTSNLPIFRDAVQALIERTKAPLENDQDFADRKALCKYLRTTEANLKLKADEVIGQISDVAAFSNGLKDLAKVIQAAALTSEKLVEREEQARKDSIRQGGERALTTHLAGLQARFDGRVQMPTIKGAFAEKMKGLRSLASMQNAIDTELANRKIEANAIADTFSANLRAMDAIQDEHAGDYTFLFRDLQQIIGYAADPFAAVVKSRIETYVAAEAAKAEVAAEAARERIRNEERAKVQAETEAKAKKDREEAAAEQKRLDDAAKAVVKAETVVAAPVVEVDEEGPLPSVVPSIIDDQVRGIEQTATPITKPRVKLDIKRPSDDAILAAVMAHFNVERPVAASWLLTMNAAELAKVAA